VDVSTRGRGCEEVDLCPRPVRIWGVPLSTLAVSDSGELAVAQAPVPLGGSRRARREAALIRAAQAGSVEAIGELFRRHWRPAHRAALLVVHDAAAAEDIAQEAFLSAIRALDRFDRRRPFAPWLHRIVVNRAIDWARRRALRAEVDTTQLAEPAASQAAAAGALSDDLMAALAALAPEHRAVVVLRHLLEYTPGEIAEILELPRGTVNSRLRRALDRLQEEPDARG
jgi:RNA polymerase sigma-70 factor, ECF subfamily